MIMIMKSTISNKQTKMIMIIDRCKCTIHTVSNHSCFEVFTLTSALSHVMMMMMAIAMQCDDDNDEDEDHDDTNDDHDDA